MGDLKRRDRPTSLPYLDCHHEPLERVLRNQTPSGDDEVNSCRKLISVLEMPLNISA